MTDATHSPPPSRDCRTPTACADSCEAQSPSLPPPAIALEREPDPANLNLHPFFMMMAPWTPLLYCINPTMGIFSVPYIPAFNRAALGEAFAVATSRTSWMSMNPGSDQPSALRTTRAHPEQASSRAENAIEESANPIHRRALSRQQHAMPTSSGEPSDTASEAQRKFSRAGPPALHLSQQSSQKAHHQQSLPLPTHRGKNHVVCKDHDPGDATSSSQLWETQPYPTARGPRTPSPMELEEEENNPLQLIWIPSLAKLHRDHPHLSLHRKLHRVTSHHGGHAAKSRPDSRVPSAFVPQTPAAARGNDSSTVVEKFREVIRCSAVVLATSSPDSPQLSVRRDTVPSHSIALHHPINRSCPFVSIVECVLSPGC